MAVTAQYTYQLVALVTEDDGLWVETVAEEDGVSKAHVIRQVFRAGREIVERQREAAKSVQEVAA